MPEAEYFDIEKAPGRLIEKPVGGCLDA